MADVVNNVGNKNELDNQTCSTNISYLNKEQENTESDQAETTDESKL